MRWILGFGMLISLGFAPAPVYRPNKNDGDPEKLRGTWRSVAFRVEGRNIDKKATWKFHNGDLDIELVDSTWGGSYRVDTKSSPQLIVLKILGKNHPVLYTFEGDTLTVYFNEGLSTAPIAFDGEKKGQNLIVFERRK